MKFKLHSPFPPAGDQGQAIEKLTAGLREDRKHQVLLGTTGSGKTFSIANVIQNFQLPVLVISHNKTLAAQLYQEFRDFFPGNGVGYFVSYYDYYQPEAYIPQTDTYIAKETDINEDIDKLRLQATSLLFSRSDAIIVASVSCIYNLGSPLEYKRFVLKLSVGQKINREQLLNTLVSLHYSRAKMELFRGNFRLRQEAVEMIPAYADEIIRIEIGHNRIKTITSRPLFGPQPVTLSGYALYPAKHFLTNQDVLGEAFRQIKEDLKIRLSELAKQGKELEAHRLKTRVDYDLEMIREVGYVNGIENYSRYFDGRRPGDPPWTLLDYFRYLYQDRFLLIIDESHMTVPQIRGMYNGDLSRKRLLIDFGFRLPSCLDNRPLKFKEFLERMPQTIYISATPDEWEITRAHKGVVEQLIRPTGLLDPEVMVRPTKNQIKDLVAEIIKRKEKQERVLVVTLTKKMAEELAYWLQDAKNTPLPISVHFLHADLQTLERSDILADLRLGRYDVIVGVNLLREGLDLPEVSLVAILDADKEGFLRSRTSLIQTMGRAARHQSGMVILYADRLSLAMRQAIKEVKRRRRIQSQYNQRHGFTPQSIQKPIRERIVEESPKKKKRFAMKEIDFDSLTPGEIRRLTPKLKKEMRQAAAALDFEKAAIIRDMIRQVSS